MNYLYNNSFANDSLYFYSCGFDATAPGHTYGPTVRSGYMLHYVLSGKGIFTSGGQDWALHQGDFFFIAPGEIIKYAADATTPWAFFWMGFRGSLVTNYLQRCKLSPTNPVFHENQAGIIKNLFSEIIEVSVLNSNTDILLTAKMTEMLYLLCHNFPADEPYIPRSPKRIAIQAMQYIRNHYDRNIKIEDIARYLNIDRTYLHRLFSQHFQHSPKEYLTRVRLDKAQALLLSTQYSVATIAFSVGYQDALLFSKVFRNATGLSPTDYRQQKQRNAAHQSPGRHEEITTAASVPQPPPAPPY